MHNHSYTSLCTAAFQLDAAGRRHPGSSSIPMWQQHSMCACLLESSTLLQRLAHTIVRDVDQQGRRFSQQQQTINLEQASHPAGWAICNALVVSITYCLSVQTTLRVEPSNPPGGPARQCSRCNGTQPMRAASKGEAHQSHQLSATLGHPHTVSTRPAVAQLLQLQIEGSSGGG